MTLPFVEQDIRDAFGPVTFQRGTGYAAQGSVRDLEIAADGRRLWAQVRGSARRPYRVQVTIAEGRGRRIVSYCTCPVGGQCKHGVALMMAALRAAGPHHAPIPTPRPPAPPPPPPDPLAGPVGDWLARLAEAVGAAPVSAGPPVEQVLYILDTRTVGERTIVALMPRAARRLKAGGWGAERDYAAVNLAVAAARFVRPADALIGRLMTSGQRWHEPGALADDPDTLDLLLQRVLATGRCHWRSKDGPVLGLGPERPGRIDWVLNAQGAQLPVVTAEAPGLIALPAVSPWYVDPEAGARGPPVVRLAARGPGGAAGGPAGRAGPGAVRARPAGNQARRPAAAGGGRGRGDPQGTAASHV